MRQLTFLLICLSFTMNVFANNNAQLVYNDAKKYYERGLTQKGDAAIALFEKAREGFEICQGLCRYSIFKPLDKEDLQRWISKCEEAICYKRQQEKDEREAAIATEIEETKRKIAELKAAERRAAEERLAKEEEKIRQKQAEELETQRKKRIEDKLVYVLSDAYIFDRKYPDMHSAIKGHLSEAGFKFTDDPERAYWSVYISAAAYEYNQDTLKLLNKPDVIRYISAVVARVKIVNNIKESIDYENEFSGNLNGSYRKYGPDYVLAANSVYCEVNEKLGEEIVNNLKQ